jgi:hypothetical protein
MLKKPRAKNRIIPQMHDVRPVDSQGNLDLEKIKKVVYVSKGNISQIAKTSPVRSAPTFYDVRQLTPQEKEVKRFREAILEEKEKASRAKRIAQHADDRYAAEIKIREQSFLKEKLAEDARRLAREREANLIFQQEKKEQEAQKRRKLLLRKTATEKQKEEKELLKRKRKEEKDALKRKRKYEAKLARELFINKFWHFFNSPFRALTRLKKRFSNSIKDFFEIFIPRGRAYAGYQTKSVGKKNTFSFFAMATCVFCLVFGVGFFYRSLRIKSLALENGKIAYASLTQAKDGLARRDFNGAIFKFNEAYERFDKIQKDINSLGSMLVESSQFVPYLSRLSSGSHLSEAGKNISRIGTLSSEIMKTLDDLKNPLAGAQDVSYLKIFQDSDKNLTEIALQVDALEGNLDMINLDDIPEEQRTRFVELKKGLPEINKFVASFSEEEKILSDVLGGNGPRKYLFLFQNNQEMRATGGFIGTYAVLDIADGNVKSFFVDGIFNPDGQLREKIIPPAPIQKISAAWSLHDSNWFPDFPKSAEKAAWFYEKTGGPTVDGVITMTPTVMQKLLEITGPIEMPEYEMTIDKDNFLENIQNEVEVDYDKELNQPKKILADLAPKILDRIFNVRNISDLTKTLDVLLTSLNEKHILIYSKNYNVEKMLSDNGWSGEVLNTQKDYLSVINTNINGYKTDGVIDEKIEHKAEIQTDGSIIDTVSITRHHNGGDTPYDWWNKVNADYMRVYVPKGSKLIRASGQTNEFESPPIDYHALGFKKDAQVGMEEDSMTIDKENGTRIYEDSDKTVFANWVYVSPKESVTMSYSYLLPFKLDTNLTTKPADTYSLLAQKQSGSVGSQFSSQIVYPDLYQIIWKYPNETVSDFSTGVEKSEGVELKSDLKTDKFIGVAFEKNNP